MNSCRLTELPEHLRDLNPEQLEAVQHADGPLLIFAGAGSGKTRVLTRRIANLVLEHRVPPAQILALTFTNKAAAEMKRRVHSLFPHNGASLWVSTFHSSCVRILRRHAQLLDFSSQFVIYDTSDARSALKRVYKHLNIDPKILDPRSVLSRIDKAKNEYKYSDAIREDRYIPTDIAEMIANVYDAYQNELRISNAMDFGDLLCNVVSLFKLEPEILQSYQKQFRYLLIDEYQDTNRVQYMLVRMLSEKHNNICVVGDDDQSIYAFRGASVQNILNFRKDYPGAKVITLETNYRSTKTILDSANSIIAKNSTRQKKEMRTDNPVGEQIVCFRGYDEREEASFVVRELSVMLSRGISPKEIAIFYRTNAQSRALEEELCAARVPYEIYGGHRFYDRKEIKDILAYFRLVLNHNDNEAFLRIINTPTRGLGNTSVAALIAHAQSERLALYPALKQLLTENSKSLTKTNKNKFADFVVLIEDLTLQAQKAQALLAEQSDEMPSINRINAIAQFLRQIAEKSSYLDRLKHEDTLEAESRIENIFELYNVAAEFVGRAFEEETSVELGDFLDRASLASDLDKDENTNEPQQIETISLMTLHLAKGLEFDCVFLVGLEEGLLPHVHSLDDRAALEEERRLCYVGITRARKRLFLTRAENRHTFGRSNWYTGQISRFAEDLPKNLIEDRQSGFLGWG